MIKIRLKLLKIKAKKKKVKVPIPVLKKLMKDGLASSSVLRKITLDPTNVSTAKIAISSPNIEKVNLR
jgi:hypothetical protein